MMINMFIVPGIPWASKVYVSLVCWWNHKINGFRSPTRNTFGRCVLSDSWASLEFFWVQTWLGGSYSWFSGIFACLCKILIIEYYFCSYHTIFDIFGSLMIASTYCMKAFHRRWSYAQFWTMTNGILGISYHSGDIRIWVKPMIIDIMIT